jgi:hypothetical protein
MSTTSTVVTHWYFHCPECGLGDSELGHHATTEMIWCEVCLEEQRHVPLKRWPVDEEQAEEDSGALASGSGALGPGFRGALLRRRTFLRRR